MSKGFSLVEMAVVLTVFSLLLGGMLGPLAKQYQFRREREARHQLSEIVEALYGYALIHRRLPEAVGRDGLPWDKLGAPRTDPWGRPWRYRAAVVGDLCSPSAPIRVREAGGATVRVTAVVVSEGKRAFATPDERENRDGDRVFVHAEPAENRFDDLVAWVHPTVLANRAALAGLCDAGYDLYDLKRGGKTDHETANGFHSGGNRHRPGDHRPAARRGDERQGAD